MSEYQYYEFQAIDRPLTQREMAELRCVRADLARGDLRTLYLGWLLRVQTGELDAEEAEPPVPPGLGQLSAALEILAEFLGIDSDLLHVAADDDHYINSALGSGPVSERYDEALARGKGKRGKR